MRAILIDVANRALTEVELPDGDTSASLAEMHKLVGGYLAVAIQLPNSDVIFVDEEGMLKGRPPGWFVVKDGHQPFAGNGLVVGTDGEGNSVAAKTRIEDLDQVVSFGEVISLRDQASSRSSTYWFGADGRGKTIH